MKKSPATIASAVSLACAPAFGLAAPQMRGTIKNMLAHMVRQQQATAGK